MKFFLLFLHGLRGGDGGPGGVGEDVGVGVGGVVVGAEAGVG